jgi:hypothetical protein
MQKILILFFFGITGALNSEPLHQPCFVLAIFEMISQTICADWLWITILLISAFQVARITGMSHRRPALSLLIPLLLLNPDDLILCLSPTQSPTSKYGSQINSPTLWYFPMRMRFHYEFWRDKIHSHTVFPCLPSSWSPRHIPSHLPWGAADRCPKTPVPCLHWGSVTASYPPGEGLHSDLLPWWTHCLGLSDTLWREKSCLLAGFSHHPLPGFWIRNTLSLHLDGLWMPPCVLPFWTGGWWRGSFNCSDLAPQ